MCAQVLSQTVIKALLSLCDFTIILTWSDFMKHLVMRTSQFAVTILHYAISPLNQMEVEAFPRCLVSFTGFALIIVLTDPRVIVGQP